MWSCYKGKLKTCKVLLDAGANPNVKGEVGTFYSNQFYSYIKVSAVTVTTVMDITPVFITLSGVFLSLPKTS